jgi:hypothetical protein
VYILELELELELERTTIVVGRLDEEEDNNPGTYGTALDVNPTGKDDVVSLRKLWVIACRRELPVP